VTALVVGGDSNVHELGGGVGIAQSDDRDVNIRSLLNSLSVGAGVGNDNEAGLLERTGDVVCEVAGGETTRNSSSTSVSGEL